MTWRVPPLKLLVKIAAQTINLRHQSTHFQWARYWSNLSIGPEWNFYLGGGYNHHPTRVL